VGRGFQDEAVHYASERAGPGWWVLLISIFEIGEFSRMETETGVESDRPRDDEIQAFHNQIRAADAEKLEFVGEKVGLSSFTSGRMGIL